MEISVFIPKMLQNMGGTYRVIRAHEGKAQELASTVEDAKITFSTALFSTYALVVKVDMPNMTPAPVNPGGTTAPGGSSGSGMLPGTPGGGAYVPTVPKTGDESWVLQAVLMLLGALSMMALLRTRRNNH